MCRVKHGRHGALGLMREPSAETGSGPGWADSDPRKVRPGRPGSDSPEGRRHGYAGGLSLQSRRWRGSRACRNRKSRLTLGSGPGKSRLTLGSGPGMRWTTCIWKVRRCKPTPTWQLKAGCLGGKLGKTASSHPGIHATKLLNRVIWIQRLDSTEPAHCSCCLLTVSGRDYVDRPTHEFCAQLDCRGIL